MAVSTVSITSGGVMKPKCQTISEDRLELYLSGQLTAQVAGNLDDISVTELEDHLLICPICLTAAETHELLMTAFKSKQAARVRPFTLGAGQGL